VDALCEITNPFKVKPSLQIAYRLKNLPQTASVEPPWIKAGSKSNVAFAG
jgi:hypothetical protein